MEQSHYIRKRIVERYTHQFYFRGAFHPEGLEAIERFKAAFDFPSHIVYRSLPHTFQHYIFLRDYFAPYLEEPILDVGSRSDASEILDKQCVSVDKNNSTLPPFDWEKELLPFPDSSFPTVLCLDTLEHIDDIHRGFNDLLRVTKKFLIISLPNNWRRYAKYFSQGFSMMASYGLPPEKPMDRHKWFFNTEEVEDFIAYNTALAKPSFRILDVCYHVPVTRAMHKLVYPFGRSLLPERYFKNFFVTTVYVCLEKLESENKV